MPRTNGDEWAAGFVGLWRFDNGATARVSVENDALVARDVETGAPVPVGSVVTEGRKIEEEEEASGA